MTPAEGRSVARSELHAAPARAERFHALYCEHFDFVFRNLRRLGVASAAVDDALQDVFVVALRRLDGYRDGTHPRAWLFAIALRVAGNYRRAQGRRAPVAAIGPDALVSSEPGPVERLARSQAAQRLHAFLGTLDDDMRAVLVLAELEQMTAPEIAEALSVNANTVYSRLRAARIAFEHALAQWRAGDEEPRG